MFSATNNKTWNSKWPQKCKDGLVPMSNIPKSSAFRCRVMGVFSALWMPFLTLGVWSSSSGSQKTASSSFRCHIQARQHPQRDERCILLFTSLGISPSQRSLDSADFLGTELDGVSQASLQLGVVM